MGLKAAGAVLCLFALLTVAIHRDLARHLDRAIYIPPVTLPADGPPLGSFARGDQFLHIWALATNLRHLRHDPGALLEANGFHPHPRALFFSDHLFGEALVLLPLTFLTTDPVLLHNLAVLLSFVLSGLGMTWLVHALSGSVAAGIVAGVGWAFSPPRSFEIFQLQLLTTQWIPFLFLFIHRTLARPRLRTALAAGAFLGLQMLSGIYVGTYLVLCLIPFLAFRLLGAMRTAWAPAWRLGIAFGLAALATVPWFGEYLRVRDALGEYGGLLENVAYGLSLQHYVLPSWALGADRFPGPLVLSAGVLALLGAVAGSGSRRDARLAYALTAVWAALLSLGPYVRWGAGPEWSAAPGFLGRGPYAILYAVVPGLDALRVPARMSLVGSFFLAVLSGLGAARLLRSIREQRGRVLAAALLAGAVLAESRPRAPGIEILPVDDEAPAVYRWLRDWGEAGAVVELPMGVLKDPAYLYHSTVHWRPLVNGYGAYQPPLYLYLQRELLALPAPAAVAALREIGVRYVVAHGGPPLSTERSGGLGGVASFRDGVVYEVEPGGDGGGTGAAPKAGLRELPRRDWRGTAGANPAQATLAYDGDPRTAWSNVGDLTGDLLGPDGGGLAWLRQLDSWPAYRRAYLLGDRPEYFVLDLGRTVDPARVEILLRAHQTPVFAPFVANVSTDGITFRPLACPWYPAAPLHAYAEEPARTWLELRCDVPPLRFLRVEQGPVRFRIYWELADIRVYTAGE
jgi:hypothetical protein